MYIWLGFFLTPFDSLSYNRGIMYDHDICTFEYNSSNLKLCDNKILQISCNGGNDGFYGAIKHWISYLLKNNVRWIKKNTFSKLLKLITKGSLKNF